MDDGSLWDYLSIPVRERVKGWLGASMNSAEIVFPAKLANACADVVRFVHFGGKAPSGLALLQDWLEDEGWDQLVGQWRDVVALKTSNAPYNDDDLRWYSEIEDSTKIGDQERILFAKQWLADTMEENDSHWLPSVHHCIITRGDGLSAILGCTVQCYGQGGNEIEWHGAFKDLAQFLTYISDNGYDLRIDPEIIESSYIHRYWCF